MLSRVQPMSPDPSRLIAAQLRPGEELLWAGRPDPAVTFAPSDAFMIPMGIAFCAFIVFWEATVVGEGAPLLFALWGVPFMAMGLNLLVGRFFVKRWQKRRTVYGLTDRRAVVLVGDRSLRDGPVQDQPTDVRRSRDGKHVSVTFGAGPPRLPVGAGSAASLGNTGMEWMSRGAVPLAFYDVEPVQPLLDALATAARGPR